MPGELHTRWPACLTHTPPDDVRQALGALGPDGWEALIREARSHQLAPLLYWRLHAGAPTGVAPPPAAMAWLREIYLASAVQSVLRERELRLALQALVSADVRPIVYKGAALAHTVYPAPACRPMGDIDLWVSREEMPRARQALESIGYGYHEKRERPLALQSLGDGEVQMIGQHPRQGLIELHWGAFAGEWLKYAAAVDREAVRRRAAPATLLGQPVLLLAPEDALIQIAVHVAVNHQMTLSALRSLADAVLLAAAGMNWAELTARARAWRLAAVTGLVLGWAGDLFDAPEVRRAAAALAVPGLRRWLVERWVTPDSILQRKPLSTSRQRLLYQFCLVDRWRDAARLMGHAVWPDTAWLAARYGRRDLSTRLKHMAAALSGSL